MAVDPERVLSVVAPALPVAPPEYQRVYHEQLCNTLRLYFNQVNTALRDMVSIVEDVDPVGIALVGAPVLPVAPAVYQRVYHEQLNSVLRLYFTQVSALVLALVAAVEGIDPGEEDLENLLPLSAPVLPVAPSEYQRVYHEQLNNVLRLYFNLLDIVLREIKSALITLV